MLRPLVRADDRPFDELRSFWVMKYTVLGQMKYTVYGVMKYSFRDEEIHSFRGYEKF